MNERDFNVLSEMMQSSLGNQDTATNYLGHLRRFRTWCAEQGESLETVDVVHVKQYFHEMKSYYSNTSSLKQIRASLRLAYRQMGELTKTDRIAYEYDPERNPVEQLSIDLGEADSLKAQSTKQDLQYLKPAEVQRMVEDRSVRDELLIRLMFQTGMRVSEVINVRLEDIDRDERSIRIRGKGAKNRIVAYQPSLDVLLERWVNVHREAEFHAADSAYLFPTRNSERISALTVRDVVLRAAEDAGLQEVYDTSVDGHELRLITPHTLRHSFAMAALDRGMNLKLLSSALGHADVSVTADTYLHVSNKEIIEGYQRFGPTIVGYKT
jgi:integrase/recombinase XerD